MDLKYSESQFQRIFFPKRYSQISMRSLIKYFNVSNNFTFFIEIEVAIFHLHYFPVQKNSLQLYRGEKQTAFLVLLFNTWHKKLYTWEIFMYRVQYCRFHIITFTSWIRLYLWNRGVPWHGKIRQSKTFFIFSIFFSFHFFLSTKTCTLFHHPSKKSSCLQRPSSSVKQNKITFSTEFFSQDIDQKSHCIILFVL